MGRKIHGWLLIGALLVVHTAGAQSDAQLDAQPDAQPDAPAQAQPAPSEAPTPTQSPTRKAPAFAALVQYKDGDAKVRTFRKQVLNLEFKDTVAAGETVLINKDSTLKLITANRCILVVYGKALLKAPATAAAPWQVRGGSARVICPSGQSERLRIDKAALEVREGEFFFHDEKLIVLKEQVASAKQTLETGRIYAWKGGDWQTDEKPPTPVALYEFQSALPAPVESAGVEKPPGYDEKNKPEEKTAKDFDRNRTRWEIATVVGGTRREFDDKDISDGDIHTEGFNLVSSKPLKSGRSLVLRMGHREFENQWRGHHNDPLSYGLRGDGFELMAGLRGNHANWWSIYGLIGFGWYSLRGEYFDQFTSLSINSEMLSAQLAFGADILYHPFRQRGLGIRLGLEFHYAQGLKVLSEHINGHSGGGPHPPLALEMQEPYSLNGLQFQLGLFFYF